MKAATAEGKKKAAEDKKKEMDFREGANLPWPGVLMVVAGLIILLVAALFLMFEITRPAMYTFNVTAGIIGTILGFGLIFFAFGKWANL
jgi:hypothetical protein